MQTELFEIPVPEKHPALVVIVGRNQASICVSVTIADEKGWPPPEDIKNKFYAASNREAFMAAAAELGLSPELAETKWKESGR